ENAALIALAVCEIALVIYWGTIGRALASVRSVLVLLAVAGGIATLVAHAFAVPVAGGGLARLVAVASFITSSALLGGACGSMILGHWYLILPSMDVGLLQSMVKFHIA